MDARVGQRGVCQDDATDDGDRQRQDLAQVESFAFEEADRWCRDEVEEAGGHGEVEGGEGDLGVAEGWVGEDSFVGEDLHTSTSVTILSESKLSTDQADRCERVQSRATKEAPAQACPPGWWVECIARGLLIASKLLLGLEQCFFLVCHRT